MKQAEITVEYKDHMGTDLTVVNAARSSFGKESHWVVGTSYPGAVHQPRGYLRQADANLIRFLATGFRTKDWDALLDKIVTSIISSKDKDELTEILQHYKKSAQHWAPFGHPHMQIRMKLPMFLARQFVKHQVGGVWSEESRRYMSNEPEFWFPKEWHGRPEDIKQGSDGLVEDQGAAQDISERAVQIALDAYGALMKEGVAPEEARIVLPLNTMTTVTWTGSLLFWSRVCNQRLDSHAQKAANDLAQQIADIAQPLFPVSWAALVGD
ncbi:MAG: hypothetical protein ACD_85C00001G0004 [uncultured bacterium]|nr:MAG: hypothetical protein ACD_85C00001G0004 [uncultured bacterium]